MLRLIGKELDEANSPILFEEPFTAANLERNWKVYGGEWRVEEGWLTGRNPLNCPGMIVSGQGFPGDILLEFEARTLLPSTHDIDFMWNGSWDEEKNMRGPAYVGGIQGWWEGKIGFEKSPDYRLMAATPLFPFEAGKSYHIQAGSIQGHCFIFIDGRLMIELTDPDPIDSERFSKIGFEAYSSCIQIRGLKVRRIQWEPVQLEYSPEF